MFYLFHWVIKRYFLRYIFIFAYLTNLSLYSMQDDESKVAVPKQDENSSRLANIRTAEDAGLKDQHASRRIRRAVGSPFYVASLTQKLHVTYLMLFGDDENNAFDSEYRILKKAQFKKIVVLLDRKMFKVCASKGFNKSWKIFKTYDDQLFLFVPSKLLEILSLSSLGFKDFALAQFNPIRKNVRKLFAETIESEDRSIALSECFKESPMVEKSIILGGHGLGGTSDPSIADLDKKTFMWLLDSLCILQDVKIVIIESCYAGGVNRIRMFEDELGKQRKLPFVTVIANQTDVTSGISLNNFGLLNRLLKLYRLGGSVTSLFSEGIERKAFYMFGSGGNFPVVRAVNGEAFTPVLFSERYIHFLSEGYSGELSIPKGRIIKSSCKSYQAPKGKIILFNGFFFPCTLNYAGCTEMVCTFLSSIPGPSYCLIKQVNVEFPSLDSLRESVSEGAEILDYDSTQRKIFFINQLGKIKHVIMDLNDGRLFIIDPKKIDDIYLTYLLWCEAQPLPGAVSEYDKKVAFDKFNQLFWAGSDLDKEQMREIYSICSDVIDVINLLKNPDFSERETAVRKLVDFLENMERRGCDNTIKEIKLFINKAIKDCIDDKFREILQGNLADVILLF